jgi:hypothetical protein
MDGGRGQEAGAVSKPDREVGGGSDCGIEMSQAWGKSMVGTAVEVMKGLHNLDRD